MSMVMIYRPLLSISSTRYPQKMSDFFTQIDLSRAWYTFGNGKNITGIVL